MIYLHPGPIVSRTDGQFHYVTAGALADLYGVNLIAPNVRVLYDDSISGWARYVGKADDVHLYPRYDGEYERIPR